MSSKSEFKSSRHRRSEKNNKRAINFIKERKNIFNVFIGDCCDVLVEIDEKPLEWFEEDNKKAKTNNNIQQNTSTIELRNKHKVFYSKDNEFTIKKRYAVRMDGSKIFSMPAFESQTCEFVALKHNYYFAASPLLTEFKPQRIILNNMYSYNNNIFESKFYMS